MTISDNAQPTIAGAAMREGFDRSRFASILQIAAAASFLLSVLIVFAPQLPVWYSPKEIKPAGGYAWVADAPFYGDDLIHAERSNLEVYESNRQLEFPHRSYNEIKDYGRGRFSHWKDFVYFSTSDKTDPTLNGRDYTFRYYVDPLPNGHLPFSLALFAGLLCAAYFLRMTFDRAVALALAAGMGALLLSQLGELSTTDYRTSAYREGDSPQDGSKRPEDQARLRFGNIKIEPTESEDSYLQRVSDYVYDGSYHCDNTAFKLSPLARFSLWLDDAPHDLFSRFDLLLRSKFLCGFCHQRAYIASQILNENGFTAVPFGLNGHVVAKVEGKEGKYILDPDYRTSIIAMDGDRIPISLVESTYRPLESTSPQTARDIVSYYESDSDNVLYDLDIFDAYRSLQDEILQDAAYFRWTGLIIAVISFAFLFSGFISEFRNLIQR